MRIVTSCLSIALLAGTATAQQRLPILDMHVHALPADAQGPPPLGLCTPIDPFPAWDAKAPWGATFMAMVKEPDCADPVWSPKTDQELMTQTIELMKRLNIVGVVSGPQKLVASWVAAAPDRFIQGLGFQLGSPTDEYSTDSLRRLHAAGRLAVLGEVTNQYMGIAPDDARMEPYWTLAEELDIPVGSTLAQVLREPSTWARRGIAPASIVR